MKFRILGIILIAVGLATSVRASGPIDYLPVGTQVGSFHLDYDLDGYTTGTSTLPSNLGAIGGMTRLPNNDMALIIGSRHSTDLRAYVYIFRFDLTLDPPYTIIAGPIIPNYPAHPDTRFGGGLTYLGSNDIALRGSWREDKGGGDYEDHAYLFRMNLDGGGVVTLITEFPATSSDHGYLREMVYLPAAGSDPEGWAWTRGGSTGYDYRYWITTWGNLTTPTLTVSAASLHLSPNGMVILGNLNNGDLMGLGFVEGASSYEFDQSHYCTVRFGRDGAYKGIWLVGSAIEDTAVDLSMGPFGELSNGDLVVGTGWQSINGGEASSYHYYIIRPPEGAGAPIISLSTTSIGFPQIKTGETTSATLTISNPGSSNLIVSQFEMTGTDGARFSVTPEVPLDIAPGFGFPGPESSVTTKVAFQPQTVGPATAQLKVHSNDPEHSKVTVYLSGYGISPLLSNDVLSTISQEVMPDFCRLSGMHFTPDGSRLVVAHQTWTFDWTWQIRSFRVLRDTDCRMTGLDTTTYTQHAVLARGAANTMGVTVGPDGMVWTTGSAPTQFVQIKPDGTRFDQATPSGVEFSHIEIAPDGEALLSVVSRYMYRYPLSKNGDGFWVLGAPTQIPYQFPSDTSRFAFCLRPDGMYDLFLRGRLRLCVPPGFFAGADFSDAPTEFWENTEYTGDCMDPMTNDLIFCDQTGSGNVPVRIRRRGGTQELFGTTLVRSRLCNILVSPALEGALTSEQRATVDANGDGRIDIADMIHLVNTH